MKINVSRVPEEGLTEHATYDPSGMDMERLDIHLKEPFEVDAKIALADKELVVQTQIKAPVVYSCARCLDEFPATVQTQQLFSYRVAPTDVVDITDDVRQEIILAYPMFPICQPDCKGLCTTCGQNLNHALCAHHAASRAAGA